MTQPILTQERLKTKYHYDPKTGDFRYRTRQGGGNPGHIAGYICKNRYRLISVDGKKYPAHRLAWLYVYGAFPLQDIDHINQVKSDNKISNLRDVSRSLNMLNTKAVGYTVVDNRYKAQLMFCGKNLHLGLFTTKEDAIAAYMAKKLELFPTINEQYSSEAITSNF